MIGQTISHYKITAKLGEGGMGEVYLATDTNLDRPVAIKFLSADRSADPEARQRFIHEAKAQAMLSHPNIATFHDVGEAQGQAFLVMEYVEGQPLPSLARDERLSLPEILDLVIQVGEGLQAAHEHGVVHRDIKPENILVTANRHVKITDFGLAKWEGASTLTREGTRMGTAYYMSPEQAEGKRIDCRSDLFSLGVILYELICHQRPFEGQNEPSVLYEVLNTQPQPLARYCRDVPVEVQRIVSKCLEKRPEMRYQSAIELATDLRAVRESRSREPAVTKGTDVPTPPSIAVLPFTDLSAEREQEYFCDGITEEIINALTHVEGLRVVARTSAFTFKDKKEDVRAIGRRLNVDTLLEGSVRKAGARVRITVQLVNVADGYQIWSERYDREMEDIFAIQDDISIAIVEKLKLQLQDGEREKVTKRGTENLDAYTSYLRGKFLFNQRKGPALRESIEHYQQAVDKDLHFALAYAGLADSYAILGTWRVIHPETAFEKARAAAMRALEIDDSLVEAHVSLATIRLFGDWDWEGAEREYRLALTLKPQHAEAHHMYAHLLEIVGRFDSAVSEITRALELEPVSAGVNSCAAEILFYARRYQQAIAQCRKALDVAPHFLGLYGWLGMAYVQKGETEQGIETLKKALELLGDDPKLHAFSGYAAAISGRVRDANRHLGQVLTIAERRYVDPCFVAWIYAGLKDKSSAFSWLNKACDERSEWVPWLRVDPLLDNLRTDSRFHDLLERLRLD